MLTMETVAAALVARGLNLDSLHLWDAWRNEDSRWTVQFCLEGWPLRRWRISANHLRNRHRDRRHGPAS